MQQTKPNKKGRKYVKTLRRLGLSGLLLAVALTLASCAGNAGGGGNQGNTQASQGETTGGTMDRSSTTMGMEGTTGGMTGMQGMDHGQMSPGDMAQMSRQMVMPNGKYSDKAFIDAMVPHHEGAIEMARVALQRAEHPEIKQLAQNIVNSQESEIKQLGRIREREYGSAGSTTSMDQQSMRSMGMSDSKKLENAKPFDKAFIDAMIPHHESAIAMAEVASKDTKNPDVRRIAEAIVSAQEREISKMRRWRGEWYPQG